MTMLATAMTLLTLLPVGGGMYLLAKAGTVRGGCDRCGTALPQTGTPPAYGPVARGAGRAHRLVAAGPIGSSPAARETSPRAPERSLGPRTGAPGRMPARTTVFPAGVFPAGVFPAGVFPAGPRAVVEAGQTLLGFARPRLPLLVSLETAELIALNAWVTWKVSGWLLRPLDGVSAELSRIDFAHLSAGISVPRRAQEITRLSRTINQALGRVQRAKEELEDLARRQRQFASDVAHELRTPIAGLRVQLEAAQQDPGGMPLPELLETTLVQVDRLETITEDILCLARLPNCPPAEWRQVDLAALVKAEVAQRTDRRPVRLRITHGAIVTAVPSQISRVLTNLLNNAQRHSRRVVCVEVRVDPASVEIAVSDDGPGIAEADRERVFQRFTRLDDARRLDSLGTGLGLAIARDIAQAHQGTLGVEESTAGGARFVLRLPRVRQPETG
ncbi:HAMP domain-containing histidine kinase [Microbispora hainanensis]|uniref:Signal transduction histidine-protein kinase/phosphatase MprB n=2 Tax=Microbispora hainanensis TaxID=568844 RepID=A0A544Z2D2_9ACTN|nr:HAMP domain-containing histidine kinase [Microbispora hainanensis]